MTLPLEEHIPDHHDILLQICIVFPKTCHLEKVILFKFFHLLFVFQSKLMSLLSCRFLSSSEDSLDWRRLIHQHRVQTGLTTVCRTSR